MKKFILFAAILLAGCAKQVLPQEKLTAHDAEINAIIAQLSPG